jgi:hypothetical protein
MTLCSHCRRYLRPFLSTASLYQRATGTVNRPASAPHRLAARAHRVCVGTSPATRHPAFRWRRAWRRRPCWSWPWPAWVQPAVSPARTATKCLAAVATYREDQHSHIAIRGPRRLTGRVIRRIVCEKSHVTVRTKHQETLISRPEARS